MAIKKVDGEDWIDPAERLDASQKRYQQSPKGKAVLKRIQGNYYKRKTKGHSFVQACSEYLEQNPGKTVEDFLKEFADE